jgi:uncharacterized protein YbaA (DUF1428 family)
MTYYTGSVAAVPTANRDAYRDHARRAWPHFEKRGARRIVECWGEDVPPGKVTDFQRAVQATADETVVFSWIEWPDRETCDAAWQDMMADPNIPVEMGEMPFDGKRMIWGGFAPLVAEGSDRGVGYVQGFVTPVPTGNKAPYEAMARSAWEEMFRPNGCLGSFECWGEDVPRGKQTDFYRAVDARDDETIVFSWAAWPDRATCDAAARAMEASMAGQPMPEMPFDGKRMFWGGFAPVFDSDRD